MALKTLRTVLLGGVVTLASVTGIAFAAGSGPVGDYKMKHPDWSFKGAFGQFDRESVHRGYQVYREVCAACHGMNYVAFRHLGDKGGPYYLEDFKNPNDNPYVKNFAAEASIPDIDTETGDPIDRAGIPGDYFPNPFPNAAAAQASNGGSLPPDLSNMVKARSGGADYLYNLMIAYGDAPNGVELATGQHWNPVFTNGEGKIAMAPPLSDGLIEYEAVEYEDHGEIKTIPAPEATVEQMAKDVTQFLAWTADPKMADRKSIGLMTLIYLLILSILLFFSYKRVWRHVKH